jgi:hypothetical protein
MEKEIERRIKLGFKHKTIVLDRSKKYISKQSNIRVFKNPFFSAFQRSATSGLNVIKIYFYLSLIEGSKKLECSFLRRVFQISMSNECGMTFG